MPYRKPILLIGVSARIYYPNTPVLDLGGVWTKTLHYLEQSVALWLAAGGALPVMVPALESSGLLRREDLNLRHYVDALDGLVLQGGNDVSPESYGEQPLQPQWAGDPVRDRYEMELIRAFVDAGKPVFGICRGLQILNVAFGGTLYQDLPTQREDGARHYDPARYEKNLHGIRLEPQGWLAGLYPDGGHRPVNSIHHQAIRELAPALRVEARCAEDGLIEAVRRPTGSFVAGVQWHPEFHHGAELGVFDDDAILRDFLQACRSARERRGTED